ncbi:hypothetical protein AA313_de0200232 [Arthrobotrys entomopaga]|nr:hypothetical protein AA313_de0200232 [Arthrobotrys entomopaga]
MLRRRHNVVLQSRPFAVGRVPRRGRPRPIQSITRSSENRLYSTAETQSTTTESSASVSVDAISHESAASEFTPKELAFKKKPIVVRKIKTDRKVDPKVGQLSDWVNRTRIRIVRDNRKVGSGNDSLVFENSQSTDTHDIPNETAGDVQPRVLRVFKGTRQNPNSNNQSGKNDLFRKILGGYQEQRKTVQPPRWQPDVIEGLDQEADLIKRTETASPIIDQTLREKLLSRYRNIPIEEPDEDVDIGNIAGSFANLKPAEDDYFTSSEDVFLMADSLPSSVADTIRQSTRLGFLAKVNVTGEILASLHSTRDWELFLKCLQPDSIVENLDTILDTLMTGPIRITREIAEPLLLASSNIGRIDAIRKITNLCDIENIYVTSAHWIRAIRMKCKRDPSKYQDLPLLVGEVVKRGLDERAYSTLMRIYVDMGRRDTVVALFNNHDKFVRAQGGLKFNFIHNTLLENLVSGGMAEEAEYIFQAMKNKVDGAPLPDAETYGIVAQVYARRPDYYPKLLVLIKDYLQRELPFNAPLFGALMKAGTYVDRLDIATTTFEHFFSRRDLVISRGLFLDYLSALMFAKVDPTDEETIAIGLPMYEKLPIDVRDLKVIVDSENNNNEGIPGEATSDGGDEKYLIPTAPSIPRTAGELLALLDLQYQHIRKFRDKLISHQNQRLFLRLFISHKFYNTFKKAYRYLALVTGLRGKKSIFPGYERNVKISFADFAKGVGRETPIDPDERYEFDYLSFPLGWIDAFPALRAAYETRDLEFANSVIADYDDLMKNHPNGGIHLREVVREAWALKAEAMSINTLAVCGDMEAAGRRFDRAIETIKWNIDRPRLFAKAIAVYTGLLAVKSNDEKSKYVFRRLQQVEMEMQRSDSSRGLV